MNSLHLPPIRAHMNNMATIATTTTCARRLLGKLQGNIGWAQMEIKPSKSLSISIIKGQLTNEKFFINNKLILIVFGKWNEKVQMVVNSRPQGLWINNTTLPGTLTVWCFQFGLLPCLMWPIIMYEVTQSHAKQLEWLVNTKLKQCLGLSRCFSKIGLYVKRYLSLPTSSLMEEFKWTKARLEMTLKRPYIN